MDKKVAQRPTIGAVIIAKDATTMIGDCLASVAWMDEIIVLDSGSSDDTRKIAEQYNAKVVVKQDWPGFGPQRRRAQSYASADWLFWIDVDERVGDELRAQLEQLVDDPKLDCKTAYSVARATDFFGRTIRHCGWYPDRVVRFHHRLSYQYDTALVHEKLDVPKERVRQLKGDLLHLTTENFDHYFKKSVGYANSWAKERALKGKRTSIAGILIHSAAAFFRKYLIQAGFLDGRHGLLLSLQSSHYVFNKYFALWIYSQGYRCPDDE